LTHSADEISDAIAHGHAFQKHVLDSHKFDGEKDLGPDLSIETNSDLRDHIHDTLMSPETQCFSTQHDHDIFYNEGTNTIVIHDPNRDDLGTCYRPDNGEKDFERIFNDDVDRGGSPDRDRIVNGYEELQAQKQAALEQSQDHGASLDQDVALEPEQSREAPEVSQDFGRASARDILEEQEQEWDRER